jgi:hypothetical protein
MRKCLEINEGIRRFMESHFSPGRIYWDHEPESPKTK